MHGKTSWLRGDIAAGVLFRLRLTLAVFILGLVISGVTAFPLLGELNLFVRWINAEHIAASNGFLSPAAAWVLEVRRALATTYAAYPFIAYGTDWLAFGHLIIALFFVGPMLDPVRNVFVLRAGCLACGLVLPLALICGPIRGIPVFWRLIDCSFGIIGAPFLWYCLRQTRKLETLMTLKDPSDGR